MKKLVSFFMDVEDPINPLADDAAHDLARLVGGCEVRGSFCVTGEKCRTLLARGRKDVLDALGTHCLGLHTDTHSFHPTTMELLADLPFEEGCEAAFRAEKAGFDAFVSAFGRTPAFWGGAGNTWSPEVTDVLKRLGVSAYSYALTELPGRPIHLFNGVFALPQDLSISESDWADDSRAGQRSQWVLEQVRRGVKRHYSVFMGHPTRFRHIRFWDEPYADGKTPSEAIYTEPVDEQTYERSQANLATFLEKLSQEFEVIGVDELLGRSWDLRQPDDGEIAYFAAKTEQNLRDAKHWPIHRPNLEVGLIVEKTLALQETVRVADLR